MIEDLVPSWTVCEHTFATSLGDPDALLFPEEAARVAQAVPKRRHEFAAVRVCARTALGRLGLPPVPLLTSKRGAPQWPDGVVGSMTHCEGYRAAVVARSSEAASIGIDAEPNGPLPDGVHGLVILPSEQEMLRRLAALDPATHWDRLLFSAKETVFKTWYPLTGRELDFTEAELTIDPAAADPAAGTFEARLLVPGPVVGGRRVDAFTGRWKADKGLVLTAVVLPAPGAPEAG
ncbi:4'-phosphopantetheinyl transferase [Streptomyces sp. NPDC085481]|uniref:4'-phosphopantetheinyl transferase n=1 Tax=Streptomyces sp. NPDC085481 TaxID=3365727 RepID=UPI0037D83EAB